MNNVIKKLLAQIQQLCVDISLKPKGKYYAHIGYSGHVNKINLHYQERVTGETTWIYLSNEITLKSLKIAKRKLNKILEEE